VTPFNLPPDVLAYLKALEQRIRVLETTSRAGTIIGPFATGTTGTILPGTDVLVATTLGPAYPVNTGAAVVLGHLEDGSFAALGGWRFDSWFGTVGTAGFGVNVRIGNPSTVNIAASLHFVIWQP
jgi:hypothetical protein